MAAQAPLVKAANAAAQNGKLLSLCVRGGIQREEGGGREEEGVRKESASDKCQAQTLQGFI